MEFVLTDLDAALTFTDVAETSGISETKGRNHQTLGQAYDTVLRLLENLSLDVKQQAAIDMKLAS